MTHAISGLWPALLTPVDPSGRIDENRLLKQARRMLAAGADGVTLFGSTGEGTAFSVRQRQSLFGAVLAGGIRADQLIVNITACAIDDAAALGRQGIEAGCAGTLFMPPFYFNQPRDEGVVASVSQLVGALAGAGRPNLLLYQLPALSNVSFSHAAIRELVLRHPDQVVGVKDSTGDLAHSLGLVRAFPMLSILIGAEPDVAQAMRAGASGSINGLANLAPRLMQRIVSAPDRVSPNDERQMRGLLTLLGVLPDLPFVSAYKTGLAEQLRDDAWLEVCPPLSPLRPQEAAAVREAYRRVGVDPETI
ncbi:MAG TPA: dihydrodipicolinate synthase family protein [Lautropia sp.]|nr:dihydrodipicolinate synthase family protein [Lautropia sp.]